MEKVGKKVEIYSTPVCKYCSAAKDFFKKNNVEYTEYNVAADQDRKKEMVEKSGQLGVPVIDVGGDIVVGYDEKVLRELLGVK
jgi:glutaredoxin 3